MNTPQADPGPADDAAGTDNDTNPGSQDAGAGKANATEELRGWFTGRLPGDWFTAAPDIQADREETRSRRIEIAREAEHKFRRKVSWGVTCADVTEMFTTLSVPVMTRLRQPERRVLDTLVEAGVARSRSDALAWCVRLTGENSDAWLARLRDALRHVEEVRDQGPGAA